MQSSIQREAISLQNKIYQESCLTTMARLPDNFINLTVTSPPYDNLRYYHAKSNSELQADVWNEAMWKQVIKALYDKTQQGGIVVWVVNDATINGSETGTSFKQALYAKEVGFNLHDTMIYLKSTAQYPNFIRYYNVFEYMFIFSKGKPKTVNLLQDKPNSCAGERITGTERNRDGSLSVQSGVLKKRTVKPFGVRNNVWLYNVGMHHTYKESWLKGHPAIFPENLAQDHILSWSNVGDIVYDPFTGSGTTLKMAILNNRNFIGSEINPDYFLLAQRRVKEAYETKLENKDFNWMD